MTSNTETDVYTTTARVARALFLIYSYIHAPQINDEKFHKYITAIIIVGKLVSYSAKIGLMSKLVLLLSMIDPVQHPRSTDSVSIIDL